jgi:ribose/xylose/arabinose/galactoside ABC-type transport system permease subunit
MKLNTMTLRHHVSRNGTLIGLFTLASLFTDLNGRFLTMDNGRLILQTAAPIAIVVFPLALLLISGSVDLSIGSLASMGAVVGASLMGHTHSTLIGVIGALAFGAAAGGLNGGLVAYLELNPIVVTIGALAVWQGIARYATNGATLTDVTSAFGSFGTSRPLGIPAEVYVGALVVLIVWWVLNHRPVGRHIYAVGGNERAAYLMGIPVKRVRFILFVVTGSAAAGTGLMYAAQLQAAPPDLGLGLELNALTIVLLGGVSFTGGSGRVAGVLAGLLFVGVLQDGLVITGASEFLQQVFVGAALILAVALNATVARLALITRGMPTPPSRSALDDPEPLRDLLPEETPSARH